MNETLKKELDSLGYKVIYKPHKIMKDYNATYNVIFEGKRITNPPGRKLGIPENEIWISEKWKKYENYVLFHELQEIKFRARGYIWKMPIIYPS